MPAPPSAGIVLYRRRPRLQVLLAHPGGPFWARKDAGAWSVPKGEYPPEEDPLAAARREFAEEVGSAAPPGPVLELGSVVQSRGKRVTAWAIEADLDPATAVSNTIEIEWPPRSGRRLEIPEVDRVAWFDLDQARVRILQAQAPLLDRLEAALR